MRNVIARRNLNCIFLTIERRSTTFPGHFVRVFVHVRDDKLPDVIVSLALSDVSVLDVFTLNRQTLNANLCLRVLGIEQRVGCPRVLQKISQVRADLFLLPFIELNGRKKEQMMHGLSFVIRR